MVGRPTEPPGMPSGSAASECPEFGEPISPPCFLHQLGPDFVSPEAEARPSAPCAFGIAASDGPSVRLWREVTRAALIARRISISAQDRAAQSARISRVLDAALPSASGTLIGFGWPFRGEFEARSFLTELRGKGARPALPVVMDRGCPRQFRARSRGDRLVRGVWTIPVPAEGRAVDPGVPIAPLAGFVSAGYRRGYAGGFYDRTGASRPMKPLMIGVGFARARRATIEPQAHDVPIKIVVTEEYGRSDSVRI